MGKHDTLARRHTRWLHASLIALIVVLLSCVVYLVITVPTD
jgi:hypothetical protein